MDGGGEDIALRESLSQKETSTPTVLTYSLSTKKFSKTELLLASVPLLRSKMELQPSHLHCIKQDGPTLS